MSGLHCYSHLPMLLLLRCGPRNAIHRLPVVLHADDDPSPGNRFIPGLVESREPRLAVVRKLAFRIVVMHKHRELRSWARRRVFEHFPVAVRIPDGENGTSADRTENADGLAGTIVDEVESWLAYQRGFAVSKLVCEFLFGTDHTLGRD